MSGRRVVFSRWRYSVGESIQGIALKEIKLLSAGAISTFRTLFAPPFKFTSRIDSVTIDLK
jgi:hypothetical protein